MDMPSQVELIRNDAANAAKTAISDGKFAMAIAILQAAQSVTIQAGVIYQSAEALGAEA